VRERERERERRIRRVGEKVSKIKKEREVEKLKKCTHAGLSCLRPVYFLCWSAVKTS
jgi:serine/threonine-protein kinase RIO1